MSPRRDRGRFFPALRLFPPNPFRRAFRCAGPLRLALAGAILAGMVGAGGLRGLPSEQDSSLQAAEQAAISEQLRSQPERSYEFSRAPLRDVLRLLADDAKISFVSVPESGIDENAVVTFTLRASPFRALEVITKANGVALFYDSGVWYLRPYNDLELIGRTYKIKYNTQETVENEGSSLNSPTAASGGVGGTQSGGGGGGGSSQDLGLSLQGATNIFKVNANPVVKDIKALLGLPVDGLSATIAPDANVDSAPPLELGPNRVRPGSPRTTGGKNSGSSNGAQVIWNSDSNTLYVVATRQQHEWVEGYLASVDRPQNLIAVEVKFFETTKDPRKQLGLDWSGTLQEGYNVRLSNLSARIDMNGIVNPTTLTGSAFIPGTAVLSAADVDVRIRAFMNDRDITTVSYPRVLTVNNREVVIRSVVNQPVLASTSSVTPGVGGTTTASVSYLPIGTIINVLPKVLDDNSIVLYVSVTVSSIIGEEPIAGNNYPIASSRVYTAQLHVDSGYTLAIGGIEEAVDRRLRNGVPGLKDIPLVGELFKSSDRSRDRKNLLIFITPTMLDPRTKTGIAQTPQTVIPITPDEPRPPAFTTSGMLVGGTAALPNALAWISRREEFYAQVVRENRTERKTLEEIDGVLNVGNLLAEQIALMKEARPAEGARYDADLTRLGDILVQLRAVKGKARKDILRF